MTTANRLPSHRLYTVKGDGDTAHWTAIGAAWSNKDQQGFTLQFDALPVNGRVVMREIGANDIRGQQ